MSTPVLHVGGREVGVDQARRWVHEYLNGQPGQYGYPSYDGYVTNDDPSSLCDGDLLAPVLLNVRARIDSFADLQAVRPQIEQDLAAVPVGVDLAGQGANESTLQAIGALYTVLDGDDRPRHVSGTTLAKVLHRKRPSLIPLYDEQVRRVYQDGPGAPISADRGRTWQEFMELLAGCMQADLTRALDHWDDLTELAPADGPAVSRLRVLDIVAWRLGAT